MVKKIFFLAFFIVLVGCKSTHKIQGFSKKDIPLKPNYNNEKNWAVLPNSSFGELKEFTSKEIDTLQADVFYVYPTLNLEKEDIRWNVPINDTVQNKKVVNKAVLMQASAFATSGKVYVPLYRQAHIRSYKLMNEGGKEAQELAYSDVKKAFEYFINNFSNGRPFIIASHSQGTHHSIRLLKEEIDGSDLYSRMVGAYIIGGQISKDWMSGMNDISVCESATQLGCLVHWDTINVTQLNKDMPLYANNICVNPITWKNEGPLSELADAKGAVYVSGEFALDFSGDDGPKGETFGPLEAPVKQYVRAQCKNGILFSSDQTGSRFQTFSGSGGNYHGLDYALFYMDIRENAKLKVNTYLGTATQ